MRLLKIAKIMIAAAAAVFSLSVNSYAGAWLHDSNGWWYINDNRTYTTDNWQQINGAWYYFDPWGYMVTGWKQVGGSWYYLHADGKMAHDTWIDGTYYVGSDGRMLTNTTTPDGYRVGADGKYQAGTQDNYTAYMTQRFKFQSGTVDWMNDGGYYRYTYMGTPVYYFRSHTEPVVDKGSYYEVYNVEVCTAVPVTGAWDNENYVYEAIGVLPVMRVRKNAVCGYTYSDGKQHDTAQSFMRKYGVLFARADRFDISWGSFSSHVIFDSEWYVTAFYGGVWG